MEKKKFSIKDFNGMVEDYSEFENYTLKKAIMAKCLDCCVYSRNEVKLCPSKSCPLYIFKERFFNKTDKVKREMTEEERKRIGKRLTEARKKKMDNVQFSQ